MFLEIRKANGTLCRTLSILQTNPVSPLLQELHPILNLLEVPSQAMTPWCLLSALAGKREGRFLEQSSPIKYLGITQGIIAALQTVS